MEPQIKTDEEYPLLRVEAGGGDSKIRNSIPTTIMTTDWNITCTPKRSWCTRWPEFVSAFWMTSILLAISFLVFYALGMSAYRRQSIVIVGCNDTNTKQGSDVFYHYVIARNAYVPFSIFSDYLSFMATQYPLLRFNVYFLIDDSWQPKYPNPRFLKRLVPNLSSPFNTVFNQNHQKDIRNFQKRYQNVKISVIYLSKYMAMTPLRFKWKMIPQSYLSFYARIYEIWQNGGIGFDLVTFNDYFNINKRLDHRIDSILKQHNNGFEIGKYEEVLESLDNEDQSDLFSMFFSLMSRIFNESRLYLNRDITNNATTLINTHRNKRDMGNTISNNNTNRNSTFNKNNAYILKEIDRNDSVTSGNVSTALENTTESSLNASIEVIKQYDIKLPNISGHRSEMPQVYIFYDISSFPDDNGPTYFLPKSIFQSIEATKTVVAPNPKKSYYLSLSPDGHFVAASSRHHPFLAQLFSSGCYRLSPKYAIKDTLFSQCSGFLRDDIYCENIRLIYNVI
ncbi:unnamed protein product [Euphydryas editha]|uniref:Uncharacterized protein n=1 Tax=Euphydryas editha TaxID=104508 RepID=A0AAU9V8F9_EUPED|nr:unnamed protein product [Euphydryas editha]